MRPLYSALLTTFLGYSKRLIVVNDGSTDDTVELLRSMAYKPEIISYGENKEKGYALKRAFSFALARGIVMPSPWMPTGSIILLKYHTLSGSS